MHCLCNSQQCKFIVWWKIWFTVHLRICDSLRKIKSNRNNELIVGDNLRSIAEWIYRYKEPETICEIMMERNIQVFAESRFDSGLRYQIGAEFRIANWYSIYCITFIINLDIYVLHVDVITIPGLIATKIENARGIHSEIIHHAIGSRWSWTSSIVRASSCW